MQQQVHPHLTIRDEALQYIEGLILDLLQTLCQTKPHNLQEVEICVRNTLPHPIDKWAMSDAQMALDKGRKKTSLVLPFEKLHTLLSKVSFSVFI